VCWIKPSSSTWTPYISEDLAPYYPSASWTIDHTVWRSLSPFALAYVIAGSSTRWRQLFEMDVDRLPHGI